MAILSRACVELVLNWPLRTWIWRGLPPFPELVRMMPRDQTAYMSNMLYAEHLLALWESGILVPARQGVPALPAPNENLGGVPNELPWSVAPHVYCDGLGFGERSTSYVTPLRKGLCILESYLPPISPCAPLPSVNFALYLWLSHIMALSPPSEPPNLRVTSETSDTRIKGQNGDFSINI